MATPYDEMTAIVLAGFLKDELDAHDAGDSCLGFLSAARNSLSHADFERFLKACRKKQTSLEKQANGCPGKISDWLRHYSV